MGRNSSHFKLASSTMSKLASSTMFKPVNNHVQAGQLNHVKAYQQPCSSWPAQPCESLSTTLFKLASSTMIKPVNNTVQACQQHCSSWPAQPCSVSSRAHINRPLVFRNTYAIRYWRWDRGSQRGDRATPGWPGQCRGIYFRWMNANFLQNIGLLRHNILNRLSETSY